MRWTRIKLFLLIATINVVQACEDSTELRDAKITHLIWVENPVSDPGMIACPAPSPGLTINIRLYANSEFLCIPSKDIRSTFDVNFCGEYKDTKGEFTSSCGSYNVKHSYTNESNFNVKQNGYVDFLYTLDHVSPNDKGELVFNYFDKKESITMLELTEKIDVIKRDNINDLINKFITSCDKTASRDL
jgi:hypothetical protein